MANIVVTSTINTIKVEFNDYSSALDNQEAGTYQKKDIRFYRFSDKVRAIVFNEKEWNLAYTQTNGCFIIDTINGVAPTSNSDLYTKLITLIE